MDRLAYWLYRALGAVAGWLPLPLLCRLGSVAGGAAYYAVPKYRKLVWHNLEIAFGSGTGSVAGSGAAELSVEERRRLARQHFATLGANLFGALGVARLSLEQVRQVVTVEGAEIPERMHREGRGCVFTIGHLGNWELFAQVTPSVLTFSLSTIYQRLGNPWIDADVRRLRAQQGLRLFERKEGFQGAIALLRQAGGVGVLADQHAGDAGLWCPFFGRLASTSSLPATLALRAGAALVSATMYTVAPGRWRMVFEGPLPSASRDVGALTAAVNLDLERRIRHAPADWFWVHNRWKTPRPKFLLATYKRGVVPAVDARPLQPFRILVRSTNWLGDAVMCVPAVRALKAGRPDARITVLTPAKLTHIWQTVAEVDEVIPFEQRDSVFGVARLIRGRFDVAMVLPNSLRSALEAWLAGVPRRVGFRGHRRAWLLNQIYREKKVRLAPPEHQVNHYLRLAAFVGAETKAWRLHEAPLEPTKITPVRIAVCPGAEYGPAKRWPAERFAEVMQRLSEERACTWTLVGVAKDAPIAAEIVSLAAAATVQDLTGKTSLLELMEELRACTLLLTNDTGTMHLAALLGVPVVAIFGSTEPALTGPLGKGHQVLRHHVDCSPCFQRECPLDFRCMKAVEPTEVVCAIQDVLETRESAVRSY